jgi:hypothetical protein
MPWEYGLAFLLAGRAVVTLEKITDGHRNTYLVDQVIDEVEVTDPKGGPSTTKKIRRDKWFVSLLVGSDNNRNYKYLGFVDEKSGARAFRTTYGTKKNKSASADNINLFGDVMAALVAGESLGHQVRIWHHGICGRCCKTLTVPASIATGVGPTCAKALGIDMKNVDPTLIEKLAALADSGQG